MFNWNGQQPRYGFPQQQQMVPGLMPQGQFHFQQQMQQPPMSWVPPHNNLPNASTVGVGMMMGQPWPPAGPAMLPMGMPGMPAMSQGMMVNPHQPQLPPIPDRPPLPTGPPLPAGPPPPLPDVPEEDKPPLPEAPQMLPVPPQESKSFEPDPAVLAELEKLKQEEEVFLDQYKNWKNQYDEWRQQNESHPNKEQFEQYLEQWKTYEKQMEARRKSIESQRESLEEKLQPPTSSQPSAMGPSAPVAKDTGLRFSSVMKSGNVSAAGFSKGGNKEKNEEDMNLDTEDMNLDDEEESACGGIIIESTGQQSSNFGWDSSQAKSKDRDSSDKSEDVSKLGNTKQLTEASDEQSKSQTDIDQTFPGNNEGVGEGVSQWDNMDNEWAGGYQMSGMEGRGGFGVRGRGRGAQGGRDESGRGRGRFGIDARGRDGFQSSTDGYEDEWNQSASGGFGNEEEGTLEESNIGEGFGFGRGHRGGRGGFERGRGGFGGGRGGHEGERGGFGGGRGGFEGGRGGFEGGRGGFEGGRGGYEVARGGFEGGRGGFEGGRGGFDGGRGGFEGGRGGFEGGRGGFEGGRGGFEGGRGGFEGGRGGFEGGRGGFEGGRGGFEGGRGGFEGGRGGFEGGRGGFEGGRGGFEGGRGGFEGGRGGFEGGRGGFEGGRGGFEGGRGGFDGGRGGFDGGRGGFEGGRGGFEGGRGGFEGGRGGFKGGRGGFDGGRGGFEGGRGGFEGGRGGFEGGRGGFEGGRGGFEGGRGGFDGGRGGFEGGRGGFDGGRGGFEGGRGGFDGGRGGFEGGRGGFDGGRGGFEGGRGGFEGRRGGFNGPVGYVSGRGGFEGGRGGFDSGRGGFEGGRGGFDGGRGGFESGRGGFERGRGGFEGGFETGRGGFKSGRGGFEGERGGFESGRGRGRGGRGGFSFGGMNSENFEVEEAEHQEGDEYGRQSSGFVAGEGNKGWEGYEDEYGGSDGQYLGDDQGYNNEENFGNNTRFGRGGQFRQGIGRGQYQGGDETNNDFDAGTSDYNIGSDRGFSAGFRGRGRAKGTNWYDRDSAAKAAKVDVELADKNDKSDVDYDDNWSKEEYPENRYMPRGGFQQRGGPRGRGRGRGMGRGEARVGNDYSKWDADDEGNCGEKQDASYFEGEDIATGEDSDFMRGSGIPRNQKFGGHLTQARRGAGAIIGRGRGGREETFSQDNEPPRKLGRFEPDDPMYGDRLMMRPDFDPYRRYPIDPYLRDPYLDPFDAYLPPPLPAYDLDPYDYEYNRRETDYPSRFESLPERPPAASMESIDYGHGNADQDKKAAAPAEVIEYGHGQTSKEETRDKKVDPNDEVKDFGDKDDRQERLHEMSAHMARASQDAFYNRDKDRMDMWQRQKLPQTQESDEYSRDWRKRDEAGASSLRSQDDNRSYRDSPWDSDDVRSLKDKPNRFDERFADRAFYSRNEEESTGSSRFDDRHRDKERWADRERGDRDRVDRERGDRGRVDRERGDRERRGDRDYRPSDFNEFESERSIRDRDRLEDKEKERPERMENRQMEDERLSDYRGETRRERRAFGIGDEWLKGGKDRGTGDRTQSRYGNESGTSSSYDDRRVERDRDRDRDYSYQSGDKGYSKVDRGDYHKDFGASTQFSESEDMFRRHLGHERTGDSSRPKSDWREEDRLLKGVRDHHGLVPSPDRHMTPPSRGHSRGSATPQQTTFETVKVEDLICSPQRAKRPPHIVVIIRGLPGSGKTYVSKLLREKEAINGGQAPRILCLDDYFMVEVEKEEKDQETGKRVKRKVLEYEYEQAVEEAYRQSMLKSFKKTVDDGFFPFIIVDATSEKVVNFSEFWSYAKSRGFQVYVAEMVADVSLCIQRNIHKWTEWDIEKVKKNWEPLPNHYIRLDIRWLLQEDAIQEVEMEDTANEDEKDEDNDDEDDEFSEGIITRSKWEFDTSDKTLDKLDGIPVSKKHIIEHQSMDDYLQLDQDETDDDYFNRESVPGKKRVRWADLEEKKTQSRRRDLGFIVGQTQRDWDRITDDDFAEKALNQTKYFYK